MKVKGIPNPNKNKILKIAGALFVLPLGVILSLPFFILFLIVSIKKRNIDCKNIDSFNGNDNHFSTKEVSNTLDVCNLYLKDGHKKFSEEVTYYPCHHIAENIANKYLSTISSIIDDCHIGATKVSLSKLEKYEDQLESIKDEIDGKLNNEGKFIVTKSTYSIKEYKDALEDLRNFAKNTKLFLNLKKLWVKADFVANRYVEVIRNEKEKAFAIDDFKKISSAKLKCLKESMVIINGLFNACDNILQSELDSYPNEDFIEIGEDDKE